MQIYKLSRKFPNIPPTFSHTFTRIPAAVVAQRARAHADLADFGGGGRFLYDFERFFFTMAIRLWNDCHPGRGSHADLADFGGGV